MKYEIDIMPLALQELDEAYEWLATQTSQHAPTWYNGLLDALYSLEEHPDRCPLANESKDSPEEVHQLLYGSKRHAFRILFSIRGGNVLILNILHAARESP